MVREALHLSLSQGLHMHLPQVARADVALMIMGLQSRVAQAVPEQQGHRIQAGPAAVAIWVALTMMAVVVAAVRALPVTDNLVLPDPVLVVLLLREAQREPAAQRELAAVAVYHRLVELRALMAIHMAAAAVEPLYMMQVAPKGGKVVPVR